MLFERGQAWFGLSRSNRSCEMVNGTMRTTMSKLYNCVAALTSGARERKTFRCCRRATTSTFRPIYVTASNGRTTRRISEWH